MSPLLGEARLTSAMTARQSRRSALAKGRAGGRSRDAARSSGREEATRAARSCASAVRLPSVPVGGVQTAVETNPCTSACLRLTWRMAVFGLFSGRDLSLTLLE